MGLYGRKEHPYCEPVAEALAENPQFARFFMERAGRSDWAQAFRCLKQEQADMRTSGNFWWKNVFCSQDHCRCPNLRGREIDIVAVFERSDGVRLGMHIECKHPGDRFHDGQAARYRERIACWTKPKGGRAHVPAHSDAVAILICDRNHRHKALDIEQFDVVIFFDEIASYLPVYPEIG